jgi:menaquinone-specific isochorismate synthase
VVHDALGRIRASELAKVVAARRSQVTLDRPIDVIEVLERLGKDQIGCVRFAFERAGSVFLGATPERLVELRGLDVTSEALAGSIARGGREDGPAGEALLASEKDRREHDLVVRGVRESLAPLCSDVRHPAEPSVCSLRNVLHLRTPVSASLAAPVHVLELVRALHPTPAVCGFPRAASAQWIRDHEPASRGWYASPVGWFDARGDGAFAVAIRSAVVTGAEAWLYAGAGIVDGSDPASEYRETAVKQLAMLWALGVEP